jgi:Competence protein CoiA-like family
VSDLVCGLDLSTGRVVQADEREVWEWYKKGHNGDRTLVCLECFYGADSPDGAPRLVPLVPRGRIGGIRQRHFAHPPGMAPAGGHSPETAWHWQTKHRLCRWVEKAAGASARTEAWTAQGKRRSDVAVTFPDGARLAIEVQLSSITDTELLARRDDYAREDIGLVWVWHPDHQIPHALFKFGEPGWVLDLAADRMGLACGRAHPGWRSDDIMARNRSPHWPPCPGDDIELRWMPLASVRLTETGFLPSLEVAARLEAEAAATARRAQAEQAAASRTRIGKTIPAASARDRQDVVHVPPPGRSPRPHLALRIDARPPWSHPLSRFYWCPRCGYLTGAQLQSSPVPHEIPRPGRMITWADLHPEPGW